MREERDRIRLMLYRNTLTNAWLVNRLEERGVVTEKTEMSSVLRGVRKGAKAETIIKTSLDQIIVQPMFEDSENLILDGESDF